TGYRVVPVEVPVCTIPRPCEAKPRGAPGGGRGQPRLHVPSARAREDRPGAAAGQADRAPSEPRGPILVPLLAPALPGTRVASVRGGHRPGPGAPVRGA